MRSQPRTIQTLLNLSRVMLLQGDDIVGAHSNVRILIPTYVPYDCVSSTDLFA